MIIIINMFDDEDDEDDEDDDEDDDEENKCKNKELEIIEDKSQYIKYAELQLQEIDFTKKD
jgi:hypothetical protein